VEVRLRVDPETSNGLVGTQTLKMETSYPDLRCRTDDWEYTDTWKLTVVPGSSDESRTHFGYLGCKGECRRKNYESIDSGNGTIRRASSSTIMITGFGDFKVTTLEKQ
jgi:hypothetical protein